MRRRIALLLALFLLAPLAAPGRDAPPAGLDPLYAFAAFLLDRPLTAAERGRLEAAAARADHAALQQELAGFAEAMAQLETLPHPLLKIQARQQILARVHLEAGPFSPEPWPELLRLLQEANPVIAVDPAAGVVITRQDLEAFLAYDAFLAELAGTAPSFPAALRPLLVQALAQALAQRQPWAQAFPQITVAWALTRMAWGQLTPAQQAAVALQLREAARRLAPPGGGAPMTMEELGAALSRNRLFNDIFMQNMQNLWDNMPQLPPP